MAVSLYLWLGSIWASVAAFAFVAALGVGIFELVNMALQILQLEARERARDIQRELIELHREVAENLDSLTEMAEFLGEQTVPNFADAVKSFKETQWEELRKKTQ